MSKASTDRYHEQKIRRLQHEIAQIDDYFYGANQNDPDRLRLHAGMIEHKRDDVVRAVVLNMHTAIEDLLDILIVSRLLNAVSRNRKRKLRTVPGRALEQLLGASGGIGFDKKVTLAVALKIGRQSNAKALRDVNRLRNKVSHNWLLSLPVRRGRRPSQPKLPLLSYGGKNLHKLEGLKQFIGDATDVYLHLYMKTPD